MFGFSKKKPAAGAAGAGGPPVSLAMRETLFGDLPPERWLVDGRAAVWSAYAAAAQSGDADAALNGLKSVLDAPGLESREYLQAWHFMRELGIGPPAQKGKQVLGVVLEVGMQEGLDLLAGYADGSARYWNYSGAGVVWDARNDPAIDAAVRRLLAVGQEIANNIGPWDKPRRPAPGPGTVRLNMLTPSGLHFGEGPMDQFTKDPMAGPLITAGIELMQLLTAKSERR